jgi:formylglycine-generating enzyme required for sulfatase activity
LIVAELRFKGASGLRFEGDFETLANRSVLDDTDTIRVNHKYIQHVRIGRKPNGHPINLDQNGHCRGDSIHLPDSLSEIIGSFSLWGWTEEDTFTYTNILPKQTVIPHMLDMMEYIEPPTSSSLDPFYMDKFETSFGMWAETTSETFIPDLSGMVSEGLLDSLMDNIDGLISLFSSDLIPLAGVSKDALSTFFNAAIYRHLPTQSQWRFAGTGEESGSGIPMLNQALILNENCNYANSGDMVEGPFHYFQAVPIDFFSTQNNDHYLVDGNRPVVSPSPYGIYQMAGNVMEWIRVPSSTDAGEMDTVLVGGSFWSPSADPLFQVEEFFQPDPGLDARADWGFRTVINDVDNSLYLKQITLE